MVSNESNYLQFLLNDNKDKTEQWKSHILIRTVNQHEGEKVYYQMCPLIEDWAMKFLQLSFREKRSEFYGKCGIYWRVQ